MIEIRKLENGIALKLRETPLIWPRNPIFLETTRINLYVRSVMHNIITSYLLGLNIWDTALNEDKTPTSLENFKRGNKRKQE